MRSPKQRTLLEAGVDRLVAIGRSLPGVRAMYVFGSFARGDIRRRSDIDILIVRETTLRSAERDLDVRRAFDVPVGIDIVVATPSELISASLCSLPRKKRTRRVFTPNRPPTRR